MEAAAEAMEFETAARLRDRIRALAHVLSTQDVNPDGIEEADVFAIACSFVVVNLLVDLLYGVLDPRIRLA